MSRPTSLSWLCQLQRSLRNVSMGHGFCARSPTKRVTVPKLPLVTPRDAGNSAKKLCLSVHKIILFCFGDSGHSRGEGYKLLVLGEHRFQCLDQTGLIACRPAGYRMAFWDFFCQEWWNNSHCTSLSAPWAPLTKNTREVAQAREPWEGSWVQLLQALTAVCCIRVWIRLQTRFKHLTRIPDYFSGSVPNYSHYY